MSEKLKILLDECVGAPIVPLLSGLLMASPQQPELAHVLHFQGQGVPDDQWLPKIATDGWIVITADRAKQCKGPKLPAVCRQLRITHIMLSARVHHKGNFDKARLILEVWPAIVVLPNEPRGAGFSLRLTNDAEHARLVKVYSP